jgi:serine/threonine protein kinase
MEYAEFDLKNYIESSYSILTLDEKLSLCISLCEGLKELYSLGYYHRDIKPDNIFMIDNEWKIGDLGLLAERNKHNEIDKVAEPIGPKGWMSPESMNKFLCEGKAFTFNHNCIIDHQSDIFQLGKVFWYIFQQNAPIGSIKERDFLIKNSSIYAVLKTMLSHSKQRRYKNIDEAIKLLKFVEIDLFKRLVA